MNILKSIYIISVLMYLSISYLGCSENPVEPTDNSYQFDSARYNWVIKKVGGEKLTDPWSVDTNQIFLVEHVNSLFVKIQGNNIDYISTYPFHLNTIDGLNNNEVYLCGFEPFNNSYKAALRKWNGLNIEEIDLNLNLPNESIYRCSVFQDESWFATQKHMIRYKNNLFTDFQLLDTNMYITEVYRTPSGEFNFISVTLDSVNLTTYIYKFDEKDWIITFQETKSLINTLAYTNLGGVVIYRARDGIYLKEGNPITKFQFYDNSKPGGFSISEFLIAGYEPNLPLNIYNWNGNKWSIELQNISIGNPSITSISPNYCIYVSGSDGVSIDNTIYIGTK